MTLVRESPQSCKSLVKTTKFPYEIHFLCCQDFLYLIVAVVFFPHVQ